MSSLLRLPNELLDHVFAFLDTAAPSESGFNSLPSLICSAETQWALKNVSLVSRRLRTIVLDRLFTHVRVNPSSIMNFLHFIDQAGLSWKVDSIVVRVSSHEYVSPGSTWWCLLLDKIPSRRIVIQGKPEKHEALFGLEVILHDAWAFKVPCQYIELSQQDLLQRAVPCDPSTGLFAAKQWQSVRVNEGSSLAAYTSYEYFLKKVPSLLASLQHYLSVSPPSLDDLTAYRTMFANSATRIMATAKMIENLEAFSYTAVFPFYNHVGEILKCVRRMKNLRKLYIKLCPEPGSSILEDAMQAASRHIDLNDPWSEYVPACSLRHLEIDGSGALLEALANL